MRLNSQNLFLALALGAFTLTATSSWASMMPAQQTQATPGAQSTQPQMGTQTQRKMQSISGTIVKSGSEYVLQASNGQEYLLSGARRAKSYVGKSVTVTGLVDSSSHSIEVQSIQPQ